MINKALLVVLLTVFGLTLSGCGPCGFFWDDWRSGKSCRSEPAPPR
jgi:hypothetical protein